MPSDLKMQRKAHTVPNDCIIYNSYGCCLLRLDSADSAAHVNKGDDNADGI